MYAVRTQLSWTHLRSLMAVPNDLARHFYMELQRAIAVAKEHYRLKEAQGE